MNIVWNFSSNRTGGKLLQWKQFQKIDTMFMRNAG